MNTQQDRFALTPRRYDPEEDWFGLEADPSSTINVPLIDPYLVEPDQAAPWYDTEQGSPETEDTTTVMRQAGPDQARAGSPQYAEESFLPPRLHVGGEP